MLLVVVGGCTTSRQLAGPESQPVTHDGLAETLLVGDWAEVVCRDQTVMGVVTAIEREGLTLKGDRGKLDGQSVHLPYEEIIEIQEVSFSPKRSLFASLLVSLAIIIYGLTTIDLSGMS